MKRLILLIFCLFSIVSWGQAIKGKVIDAQTKETIPGANIAVPGVKGAGTSTNFDGAFTYTLPAGKTQIQVSFVGYKTKTVNVQPGATVTVSLDQDAAMLDDVVIIGYGTQKKESLTAAIATVDVAKAVDSRPVPDIGRALQGTTPGLTVTINNGELGSDPKFRIRGQITSLTGDSSPLILVDNVEIPSITFVNPDDVESVSVLKDAASAAIYGARGANGVVLIKTKNGSGNKGAVSVTYSGQFSFRMPTTTAKLAGIDAYEYFADYYDSRTSPTNIGEFNVAGYPIYFTQPALERAQYWNNTYGGMSTFEPMVYGRDWETKDFVRPSGTRNYGYRIYDQYEALFKDWAPMNQHNVSIGGTSGKTSYNISLGYMNTIGFYKGTTDTYDRYNVSVAVNSEITKFFTAHAKLSYTKTEKKYPNSEDGVGTDGLWYALRWSRYQPIGATYNGGYINDSYSEINASGIMSDAKQYMSVNFGGTLKILKGWTADIDVTYANDNRNRRYPGMWFSYYDTWAQASVKVLDADGNQIWRDKDGQIVDPGTEGASAEFAFPYMPYTSFDAGTDRIRETSAHSDRVELNATSTYQARWGEHSFSAMVGLSTISYRYAMVGGTKYGLIDPEKPYFDLATGHMESEGSRSWSSQVGYFGRLDYSWKDKILVQFNGRYDGTSKYPTNLRWKFFPSGSAAYRISEENFFEPLKSVISDLKIRASYGSLGKQTVPANLYIATIDQGTGSNARWGKYGDTNSWITYGSPSIVRDDATWETVSMLDFGVDARFWKNQAGLTFDWYSRTTTDMFVPGASMPATFGGNSPKGNFGKMRTNGWELSADVNHTFKNGLRLGVTAGVADSKSKILEYSEATLHYFNTAVNGSNIYNGMTYGEIWGYKYDRKYQFNDFEEITELSGTKVPSLQPYVSYYGKYYKIKPGYVYQNTLQTPQPGGVMYKDLDGDGAITGGDGTTEDPGDKVVIGNRFPRYEYNFRFDVSWKGFDLSMFFQGVGERDAWSRGPLVSPGPEAAGTAGVASKIINNIWSEKNPNAWFPRVNSMSRENFTSGDWQQNDHYLLDMSYLRLKTLIFGYTIPERLTKKISINRLRVYFTAENLLTFDNLHVPIDPEVGTGNMSAGDDYALQQLGVTTPLPKYYVFGLQLTL